METPLEKFNGLKFSYLEGENSNATDKGKFVGNVKWIETEPTQPYKLIEWQSRDNKAK